MLLVTKGLGLGGAETLLTTQVERRDPSVVSYEVATLRPDKTFFVPRIEAAGAPVHVLGVGPSWPLRLARQLRRGGFDAVHGHAPLPAAASRLILRAVPGLRAPHLYTEHNRWGSYRTLTREANAATMGLDAWTWAVSGDTAASIRPRLRSSVETLAHGVDVAGIRAALPDAAGRARLRQELDLPADALVYVNVANRRPAKAHEVLLDAFARVARADERAHLVLVGQQLETEEFTRLVAATGVADRTTVLGYRDDAVAIMAASDVLLMSSDHEGLPVSIMEALAIGLPVVATAVGGIPEAVCDGVEGRLVRPRDPAALAAAAMELSDPTMRRRLAAGAVVGAVRFDAGRAVAAIERRYAEVLTR